MPMQLPLVGWPLSSFNYSTLGTNGYLALPIPAVIAMFPGDPALDISESPVWTQSTNYTTFTPGPIIQSNLYAATPEPDSAAIPLTALPANDGNVTLETFSCLYAWSTANAAYTPVLCDAAGNLSVSTGVISAVEMNVTNPAVGAVSAQILAENVLRTYLAIQNNDAALPLHINFTNAATAATFSIPPGTTREWSGPGAVSTQAIMGISTAANANVVVLEGST
jgi:hypothetical protein